MRKHFPHKILPELKTNFYREPLLVTCRILYWWKRGCFMPFLGIFSTRGEKFFFCLKGRSQDEIEPMQSEIEHRNENWNKHPSWGGVWARWGCWRVRAGVGALIWYTISHIWYPISPIWYPISPIWYPIPYLVFHLPYLVSIPYLVFHLPYLVSHLPIPDRGTPH